MTVLEQGATGVFRRGFCDCCDKIAGMRTHCERDRTEFCDHVIAASAPDYPAHWYCPFGLRTLGMGFCLGNADFVLRATAWLEKGNEGLSVSRLFRLTAGVEEGSRDKLLNELRLIPRMTDAEARSAATSLGGLVKLARRQAEAAYDNQIEASRRRLLHALRIVAGPLMTGRDEQTRRSQISEVLGGLCSFARLSGAALYFTPGHGSPRVQLCGSAALGVNAPQIHSVGMELLQGSYPEVGSTGSVPQELLVRLFEKDPAISHAEYVAGSLSHYPDNQAGLLCVWRSPTATGRAPSEFTEDLLCDLCRTLSVPVYGAHMMNELAHEAALRKTQAMNFTHTVRATFQAVVGETYDLRRVVSKTIKSGASSVEDTLDRIDERVQVISWLLDSSDIVEARSPQATRPYSLGDKERTTLFDLISAVSRYFERTAKRWRIKINLDDSLKNLSAVSVDCRAATLMFINLIQNALKYSHAGTDEKYRSIDITGEEDRHSVYVEISDFGLGIHPDEEKSIFLPNVQGSLSDQTRYISGTGLGLSAALEIARMHGGDVTLVQCIPYDVRGQKIPPQEILRHPPKSPEASRLLQHCLVTFKVELPKA